jgi:uncharacterized protein YndB with AHSA1/START domain
MSDGSAGPKAEHMVEISRVLPAPRATVFRAWTDAAELARWWGPQGFETPLEKLRIEPRAGGRHDKVMVVTNPEIAAGMQVDLDAEFPDHAEILEVEEPELLVLTSEPQPETGLTEQTVTRIEFHEESGDRTRLVLTDGPYNQKMHGFAEMGWIGSLDKLELLLSKPSA